MEYFKAREEDLAFIAEMLDFSNNNGSYGRGYPKGDLQGLTYEYVVYKMLLLRYTDF
ncbi:MAG: hypothetical protein FWF59_12735 [Turicibacter sp.]|nr:hypothetical protein [Turicibacter sp.]